MSGFLIQQLDNAKDLPLPKYMTKGAAGMDLYANVTKSIVIAPRARVKVPCGFKMALPEGFEAQIRPRSGLALAHGISMPNAPGTIDSDYRGEVSVLLVNHGDNDFIISRGDRIAQMVISRFEHVEFTITDKLPDSLRGDRGFGSTGGSGSTGLAAADASPKVGGLYSFAGYNWRVLDIEDGQALLLSELVLESRSYNDDNRGTEVGWDDCSLRHYLNKDFYNKLPEADRSRIALKHIETLGNPRFGRLHLDAKYTDDYVFLLCLHELVKYFGDSGKLSDTSDYDAWMYDRYNLARIAKDENGVALTWWLRTSGAHLSASFVNEDGSVDVSGLNLDKPMGIRPALWINL